MPREIIDTVSSRPAYIRRRILTTVILVIIIAALVAVGFELGHRARMIPAAHTSFVPGNSARQGNLAPIPTSRRAHAA